MMNIRVVYYSLIFIFIAGTTLLAPMFFAEKAELAHLNEELSELRNERGVTHLDLNDPEAKAILDKGTVYFKAEYISYASPIAVVVCLVVLVFVYFFKNAGRYDSVYIFGIFFILLLIGAIEALYFMVISSICAIAYVLIGKKLRSR